MWYVLFLMYYFDRWSHITSWIYLSLHGTYGLLWLLKESVFPDPSWQRPSTLLQHFIAFAIVLGPYWYFAYVVTSSGVDAPAPLLAGCVSVHTFGCVLMMASDTQKYFVLKVKKGLIADGWFANCRNTNYLGEIMIYGSYAALAQDPVGWAIVIYVWTVLFGKNMMAKEESFANKPGGKEYMARSWLIIPKVWPFANTDCSKKDLKEHGK